MMGARGKGTMEFHRLEEVYKKKNWCVPFGTQRVEAEGMSKNEPRH
jgi:hypothetical protein